MTGHASELILAEPWAVGRELDAGQFERSPDRSFLFVGQPSRTITAFDGRDQSRCEVGITAEGRPAPSEQRPGFADLRAGEHVSSPLRDRRGPGGGRGSSLRPNPELEPA